MPEDEPDSPTGTFLEKFSNRQNFILLICVSILLLLLAIASFFILLRLATSPDQPILTPPVSLQEVAEEYPELASILNDPNLDSVYKEFLIIYQRDGAEAAIELARKRGLLNDRDEVIMTLELDTTNNSDLVEQLEANGIRVATASGKLIDIAVPLSLIEKHAETDDPVGWLEKITELEHVLHIRLPIPPSQNSGDTELESLSTLNIDSWQEAGYTGDGVKIAVIDFGFSSYADLVGNDLPSDLITISFVDGRPEVGQTDNAHGTACAEIVHDIAPDARLYLVEAYSQTETGLAVEWILEQGISVISYSVTWFASPMDGTGYMNELVNDTVSKGVVWVTSAGNNAPRHYMGKFTDPDGDGFHNFSSDDELLNYYAYGPTTIVLNWDDWENCDQDYDLYIYDEDGNILASSENTQDSPDDGAYEIIKYDFEAEGYYTFAFYAKNATRAVTFNFFTMSGEVSDSMVDYSITSPGDAENAFTVAAVNWDDDLLEFYSSRGPTLDGRPKPDISGPANVSVASYDRLFNGTSAAAPHVAGAAALVLQAYPEFTPQEVKDFLMERAVDLGDSGHDTEFGIGRLWMGNLPGEVTELKPTPTEESPTPQPTASDTPSATKTATPAVEEPVTQKDNDIPKWLVPLGLLVCALIPALMGMAGLGMAFATWYNHRNRLAPAAAYSYPPQQQRPAETPVRRLAARQNCPVCGHSLQANARFCTNCGRLVQPNSAPRPPVPSQRPSQCRQCGFNLRPASKFCPNCGARRQ
ncbi:MAG: S8 family serine peptidase [Anaerolineales bacterium]|nr:S8 family serine peptidase [Anaerolineales bacterium]